MPRIDPQVGAGQPKQRLPVYIRQAELQECIPFSGATLWRKIAAGTFPQPIKLGPRVTAWMLDDVLAWLAAQRGATPATDAEDRSACPEAPAVPSAPKRRGRPRKVQTTGVMNAGTAGGA
jgi:prophage regulatory protein